MAMNKQRRTSNINNIVTYDTLKNVTIPANLTVQGLTSAGFVKTDANGLFSVDTGAYLPIPSQTGNSGKFLSTNGSVLSWQSIPQDINIYNNDGTLTGNRTVTFGSNSLTFSSSRTTGFATNINVTQTQPNGGDPGDGSISVSHSISASSATSQNVIRAMSFGSNNNLTGGGFVTNHRVWNVASSTQSGTSTLDLDQIFIERGNQANGTVTNNRAIRVNTMQGTNRAGFACAALAGTNNVYALLGTVTIPTGNWGIYQSESSFSNHFNGNTIIGGTTDAGFKLDVQGTTRVTDKLYIRGNGLSTSGDDTFNLIAYGHTRMKLRNISGGGGQLDFTYDATWGATTVTSAARISILSESLDTFIGAGTTSNVFIGYNGTADVNNPVIIGVKPWQSFSSSAILQVASTTKGFLQPRMTGTQRDAIASPATGLSVYNTTTNTSDFYNGTSWNALMTNATPATFDGGELFMLRNNFGTGYNGAIVIAQNSAKTSGYAIGNIIINTRSSFTNLTGSYNVLIGANAGKDLTTGNNNVMIGSFAGQNVTTAGTNVYIGTQSVGSLTNNGNYQIQITAGDQSFSEGVASDMYPTNQSYAFIGGGTYANNQIKHFYFGAAPLLREPFYPDANKDVFFYAPSASQVTDKSGGNFTINAGRGTGTGTPGSITFSTSTTTTSGTTIQTLTDRMRVFGNTGNVLIQSGGTFTDAGFRLDVQGTARVTGNITGAAGKITLGFGVFSDPMIEITASSKTTFIGIVPSVGFGITAGGIGDNYIRNQDNTRFFYFGSGSGGASFFRFSYSDASIIIDGNGTGTSFTTIASSQLTVNSNNKGFLPPRMTGAQVEAIASPAEGLLAYATNAGSGAVTSKGWWGYDGTTWVKLN